MPVFRDLSIKRKLLLLIFLTSTISLFLACGALIVFDWSVSKEGMLYRLETLAGVIGSNSVAALEFGDSKTATETLRELSTEPRIEAAYLYDAEGEVLAAYRRGGQAFTPPPVRVSDHRFADGHLELFRPIIFDQVHIGTVYLRSDMMELYARLRRYLAVAAFFTLAATGVALVLAAGLQRVISEPILRLVGAASQIAVRQDYSIRVERHSRDELGTLIGGFNEMLAQIQHRDRALRNARDELEQRAAALQRELSERQRAEEAREKAEQELEVQRSLSMRSDRLRSLGEMAAGIAHELNQPLVGVRGLAEHTLLGMDRGWALSEEKLRDRLTQIIEQADRMVHIIEHVRMFAREAGKSHAAPVQINQVVGSSLEMLGAQFRAHGVELEADLAAAPPLVSANSFSLEEVVLNLLSNARDAVEERRRREDAGFVPQVRVRTRQDGEAGVCVEVEDNGTGIPQEVIARVFDPFFTTKDPDKGTGLGLAISRTIVEEFDGRLEIDSTPGEGTTARLWLPVGGEEAT